MVPALTRYCWQALRTDGIRSPGRKTPREISVLNSSATCSYLVTMGASLWRCAFGCNCYSRKLDKLNLPPLTASIYTTRLTALGFGLGTSWRCLPRYTHRSVQSLLRKQVLAGG